MAIVERHRSLILGDFHYGESYLGEGARSLEEYGYDHSTFYLNPFIDACDSFVLNLETPLADPAESSTPIKKAYSHWGDPEKTIHQLKKLGVDAVSLANNHTLDRGYAGLQTTFQSLSEAGIEWFGAGRNIQEAEAPFRIPLPENLGGGELYFHGTYQYSDRNEKAGAYAHDDSPGCAPLRVSAIPAARCGTDRADTFHIAFPHWGANYKWRGSLQYQLAHRLLQKDYDLILGHGGHTMQEVHRKRQRWVVYGIGNGNFMSAGRWQQFESANAILPFSFWTILEINLHSDGRRQIQLNLYPVYSNNLETNYQPRPVTTEDFQRLVGVLKSRPTRPWRFDNPAKSLHKDELGHFIALDLGRWSPQKKPSRLPSPLPQGGDPGDWPLRSSSIELEDKILGLNKHIGASIMAIGAEADGGTAQWISRKTALLEARGKRLFAHGYGAHESVLGAAIVLDKVLTAELLEAAGVPTPKTILVKSEDDAVAAAAKIPGAVVVKPRRGVQSIGVSTNLTMDEDIRQAFRFARKYRSEILVQQYIPTVEELRVMASPNGAVAVNRRVLPHVIGDGSSSIRELIQDKNRQRRLNPSLWRRSIPIDDLTGRQLDNFGLTLDSVPSMGEMVTVRNVAGISVGADAFQALEVADPKVTEAAVAAVAAVPGMGWGGVDVIIEEETQRPFIIEINDDAGYGPALFPTYGEPRNVGSEAWRLRYEATAPEPQQPPEVAPVHSSRLPLMGFDSNHERASARFSTLLEKSLLKQGYTLERKNSHVRLSTSPTGQKVWMTVHGRTSRDRAVVHRVMIRHETVHHLLELARIPHVIGKKAESLQDLNEITRRGAHSFFLRPLSSSWTGPHLDYMTSEQIREMDSLQGQMWVQSRFQGRRVRVLATRQKAFVITSRNPQRSLDEAHITGAGELAVEAVRAIPELRWSAVDVLIRPTRIRDGLRGGLLVEGLVVRPGYSPRDFVLAGDFDAFCGEIVS